MEEIWKDIVNYEGQYQVSNYGRCKSLARMNWNGKVWWKSNEIMKKPSPSRGYHQQVLRKHCTPEAFSLHRLVAQYFIPNPLNLPEVNHKDRNKHNNHVSNLEWCTHADNMTHYKETNK